MNVFRSEFFESLAAEAKLDAEKSVMVKNTILRDKVVMRRAQAAQYRSLRQQSESGWSCTLDPATP